MTLVCFVAVVDPSSFCGRVFSPFDRRQVLAAAVTSSNTINFPVVADSALWGAPFDDEPWRTRSRSGREDPTNACLSDIIGIIR
jgi:hypothetical protein